MRLAQARVTTLNRWKNAPRLDLSVFKSRAQVTLPNLTIHLCGMFLAGATPQQLNDIITQSLFVFDLPFNRALAAYGAKGERNYSDWDEWISWLAVYAYHVMLVQTGYGEEMPPTGAACANLLAMAEAIPVLERYLPHTRQPERFIEGLTLLEFCGHPTDQMLNQWLASLNEGDQRRRVYPDSLAQLVPVVCDGSVPLKASGLSDMIHFDSVLVMYYAALTSAAAAGAQLPLTSPIAFTHL